MTNPRPPASWDEDRVRRSLLSCRQQARRLTSGRWRNSYTTIRTPGFRHPLASDSEWANSIESSVQPRPHRSPAPPHRPKVVRSCRRKQHALARSKDRSQLARPLAREHAQNAKPRLALWPMQNTRAVRTASSGAARERAPRQEPSPTRDGFSHFRNSHMSRRPRGLCIPIPRPTGRSIPWRHTTSGARRARTGATGRTRARTRRRRSETSGN